MNNMVAGGYRKIIVPAKYLWRLFMGNSATCLSYSKYTWLGKVCTISQEVSHCYGIGALL